MEIKKLSPFVEGIKNVFETFGLTDIQKGRIERKNNLSSAREVNVIIGLEDGLKGSATYSMSYATARNIVSTMMGGMPVTEVNDIVKSGICEFVNMVSANAITLYANKNIKIDNTPPTLIHGNSVFTMLSRVETIMLELITPLGNIDVNIGYENEL